MSDKRVDMIESLKSGKSIAVLEKETAEVKPAFVQLEENDVEKSNKYKEFSSQFAQKINNIVGAKNPIPERVYENDRSILPKKTTVAKEQTFEQELIPDSVFDISDEIENNTNIQVEQKTSEIKVEKPLEESVEQAFDKTELEEIQEDMVTAVPRTKKLRFRIKMIAIVFSIITLLTVGLCVHNSVKINKLNTQIEEAQTQYSVNLEKYIRKVNKLDNLNNDDNVIENVQDVSVFPADRILVGTPEALSEPAEVVVQNNWFNNLIDKIAKFFGRK